MCLGLFLILSFEVMIQTGSGLKSDNLNLTMIHTVRTKLNFWGHI